MQADFHMISRTSDKKICIHITTYRRDWNQNNFLMDERFSKKACRNNKFVCAICLNSNQNDHIDECNKKINKPCPICQKSCDFCQNTIKRNTGKSDSETIYDANVKNVQTSDTDVAQGLNLLNEVLTVFQNNKVDNSKEKAKIATYKDVSVSTEDINRKDQSKLTISTFHYSIDNSKKQENGKFAVVCSCQPSFIRNSQYAIDLMKHKSSSIPQMKLEELKYSLKEKSRSKDAIEEVNRMFATVRKCNSKALENPNRPMIRSGPRVLPVVRNLVCRETKHINFDSVEKFSCKCCQTCLSSGDAFNKPECCHEKEQSDKPTSMCCNYQKMQHHDMVCHYCHNLNVENVCGHENLKTDF